MPIVRRPADSLKVHPRLVSPAGHIAPATPCHERPAKNVRQERPAKNVPPRTSRQERPAKNVPPRTRDLRRELRRDLRRPSVERREGIRVATGPRGPGKDLRTIAFR